MGEVYLAQDTKLKRQESSGRSGVVLWWNDRPNPLQFDKIKNIKNYLTNIGNEI
jgi:hypothetical protein